MTQENPPRELLTGEERFEGHELNPTANSEQLNNDKKEQRFDAIEIKSSNEEDITEARREAEKAAVRNEIPGIMEQKPKGDEKVVWEIPPQPQHSSQSKPWLKRFVTGTAFLAASMFGAKEAKAGTTGDSTKNTTIKFEQARKVKEISPDYTIVQKEDKTYGYKVTDGKQGTLEMAKPNTGKENEKGYQEWLIQQLESGISPQELAEKKYISPDKVQDYQKFYKKPSVDVVYMEGETSKQESDPFAAFAKEGDIVYSPNQQAAAEIFDPVRETRSITENGNKNTSDKDIPLLIRYRNDLGYTGEYIILSTEQVRKYLTGGDKRSFVSQKAMMELKELAIAQNKKDKNFEISSEDLALGSSN